LTLSRVDESRNPAGGRVDWAGLVTFSAGLFCLVFALIRGNAEGWSSGPIVGLLVAAVVLLVAFALVESRLQHPMLDLSLFRKPAFDGASIAAFSLSAAMFAMFLYLTLYVQNALGYSALEAGLRFLPVTLLSFLVAPVSGKLAERFGVRWFIAGGLALVGLGLLLMRRIEPGDDWTAMLAGFMVAGGGIGAVNPALATAAISVVEPHRSGMASGINSTFRQVGIATGTAALGAIFTHVVNGQAGAFGAAVSRAGVDVSGGEARAGQFSDFISFGGFRQIGGGEQVVLAGREAFLDGLHLILLYGAITAFVSAALCALLLRPSGFVTRPEPAGEPAPGPA
jgi:predicted MFS family arabinose efflux permease